MISRTLRIRDLKTMTRAELEHAFATFRAQHLGMELHIRAAGAPATFCGRTQLSAVVQLLLVQHFRWLFDGFHFCAQCEDIFGRVWAGDGGPA